MDAGNFDFDAEAISGFGTYSCLADSTVTTKYAYLTLATSKNLVSVYCVFNATTWTGGECFFIIFEDSE